MNELLETDLKLASILSSSILLGILTPLAAMADGIELPKQVRPSMGGDFVMRTVVTTTNSVQGLQYNLFQVTKDGRIGEPLKDTTFRPAVFNTQAGQKHNLLVRFPSSEVISERLLALCMWKEPPSATPGSPSQLLASFRYCKLFSAKP